MKRLKFVLTLHKFSFLKIKIKSFKRFNIYYYIFDSLGYILYINLRELCVMVAFSIWHWVIVLIVVLILFGGKGKLSSIMGDFGKGLKNFKDQVKSNKDNEEEVEAISEQKVTLKKKAAKKQTKKKQTIKKKS